jgi:hypothetical protein
MRLRHIGDNSRQGRFSCAGWSPKNNRRKLILLDYLPQLLPFANNLFLTEKLIEIAWPHPFRKWLMRIILIKYSWFLHEL